MTLVTPAQIVQFFVNRKMLAKIEITAKSIIRIGTLAEMKPDVMEDLEGQTIIGLKVEWRILRPWECWIYSVQSRDHWGGYIKIPSKRTENLLRLRRQWPCYWEGHHGELIGQVTLPGFETPYNKLPTNQFEQRDGKFVVRISCPRCDTELGTFLEPILPRDGGFHLPDGSWHSFPIAGRDYDPPIFQQSGSAT